MTILEPLGRQGAEREQRLVGFRYGASISMFQHCGDRLLILERRFSKAEVSDAQKRRRKPVIRFSC
jgi:hypothetical protein